MLDKINSNSEPLSNFKVNKWKKKNRPLEILLTNFKGNLQKIL